MEVLLPMDAPKKAGYEYLLGYKLSVPIYDYTMAFCRRWIPRGSRTEDQMVQAARSGMQNIPEGYCQGTLSNYIFLVGVAKGSEEELLKDYQSFARQRNIPIWPKEQVYREIGEIREIWEVIRRTPVLPDHPDFPDLPEDPQKAVNLLITLVYQVRYFQEKLYASLMRKHEQEGGFRENLLKRRLEYRKRQGEGKNQGDKGDKGDRGDKGGQK